MKKNLKKIAGEPLLHFLLLGALLFGAYSSITRGVRDEKQPRRVRIGQGDVNWLRETWLRQWQREPTREELSRALTEFLREELLAREARGLGLEQNDTFIRRCLAQKMEFLVQDTSRLAEPTEDDLRGFYSGNLARFTQPARVSFTQIFFSREHRNDVVADAKAALVELQEHSTPGTAFSQFGDSLLFSAEIRDADEQAVADQFGHVFAQAVLSLQAGAWHGPIESPYGLHLVRIWQLKPARLRAFAEVRAQVLERWREQRQREDNEKYYARLVKKYDVVLDESVKPLIGKLDGPVNGSGSPMGEESVQ